MDVPAVRKRESLVAVRLGTEECSNLIKGTAERRSGGEAFESARGPVALFDAPMVLLHMVVQIAVGPVRHPVPEDVPNGAWIGIMAVRRDPVRRDPGHHPRRPKEGLGRCKVSGLTEAHIHEVAISIHRSVEVLPLALDTNIGFVHVPAVSDLTVPPRAKRLTEERSELAFPFPHGFMVLSDFTPLPF